MQQAAKGTTIHLTLPDPRRWWNLPLPVSLAVLTFCTICIVALVGRIQSAPAPAGTAVPTPGLLIVLQKEQAPVAVPIAPTPDLALRQELEQLRQRVADLEAQQAAAPVVAPAPQIVYQVTNAGPPDVPEPTPAPAQPAMVAQPAQAPAAAPAAQDEPTIHPAFPVYTPSKDGPDPITFTNVQEQWKAERCLSPSDASTCH